MFTQRGVAGIEDIFTGVLKTVQSVLPVYAQYQKTQQAKMLASIAQQQAAEAQRQAALLAQQQSQRTNVGTIPWSTIAMAGAGIFLLVLLTRKGGR